jgi:hypothetical protein
MGLYPKVMQTEERQYKLFKIYKNNYAMYLDNYGFKSCFKPYDCKKILEKNEENK